MASHANAARKRVNHRATRSVHLGTRGWFRGLCRNLALGGSLSLLALGTLAAEQSPAEERIALAKRAIKSSPGSPTGYNDLAMAQARRARETADPSY